MVLRAFPPLAARLRDPATGCGGLQRCRLSATGEELFPPLRSLRAARTHLQPTPAARRPVWPTLRSSSASRLAASGVILPLLALAMAPPAVNPHESPPILPERVPLWAR